MDLNDIATRDDLEKWFKEGVSKGKRYMMVLCDTYDHSDYPAFFDTAKATLEKKASPGDMQRVMEIYDLEGDMCEQLKVRRMMAL